jgi:uncharacterized protein
VVSLFPAARALGAPVRRAAAIAVAAAVLVLGAAAPAALALDVPPRPEGRVSDYARLLSPGAAARVERLIAEHERSSSDQIAVAIFPSLEGESLEDFSIRLAERWQIGSREHDNGVILLIFVEDRRSRLEVGYGLEGRLTDALADRILRQVLAPRFRAGDFDGGVEAAVAAVIQVVRGEYQATGKLPQETRGSPLGTLAGLGFIVLLVILFASGPSWLWAYLLGSMMSGGRGGWSSGRHGGFGGFGGGSGGWGGGGGGGFGGGGASGRW